MQGLLGGVVEEFGDGGYAAAASAFLRAEPIRGACARTASMRSIAPRGLLVEYCWMAQNASVLALTTGSPALAAARMAVT
ncbi:hypothetical protein ABT001_24910 [Streptomyces sp. NPDC002793]|uniref:hypothetical protein n=1 Tax=Streptomyces sp. NPDC002793 TaxID=3154432 RepID=UPI00332E95A6